MNSSSLKQTEVFAFLAALFLIAVVLSEQQRLENPPVITLTEEDQAYRFPSGSADVPRLYASALESRIIPKLEQLSTKHQCDTIEIIGHTDSVPVQRHGKSGMDYLSANARLAMPGSNIDLGMLRAISVMNILESAKQKGRLTNIKYISPYSAGQLTLPNKKLSWGSKETGDNARRRIEIRLLRSYTTHHIDY